MLQALPSGLLNFGPKKAPLALPAPAVKIPTVIMITAYGSADVAGQARREGAFGFFCKPFKLSTLLETVKNAVPHWEQTVH